MKKLITFFGAALVAVLAFVGSVSAQTPEKKITIQAAEITIADAFARIEKQTGYSIAYGQSAIDVRKKIALSLKDATLDKAMAEVLRSTNLTYKLNGYHVILIPKPEPPKQPQPKKNVTVSGKVTDAATGEVIIGCMVYDKAQNKGATTNAYGFYSLTLPAGPATLAASFLGYETWEQKQNLTQDATMNIALDAAAIALDEVVVMPKDQNPLTSHAGAVSVPLVRIKNAPVLMGESDMMKSLQYIPGVQGGTEGKADLSVRGGSPDQNLILLDGNPIYNANHLFGFVSVFNTDALKNVTLYKSGFPARFGGRLSSVIDINTKDGDKEHFGGSATLGLLAAKFNLEGPIVKGRTSFTLSGRRSWADAVTGLFMTDDWRMGLAFHDMNAKIHHKISNRTSVYLTAYHGRDKLKISESYTYGTNNNTSSEYRQHWRWGNTIVGARLNSALTGNLFLNANLSYNRYRYNTSITDRYVSPEEDTSSGIDYRSGITDYTATLEIEYIPSANHFIRAGIQGVMHDFRPETLGFKNSTGKQATSNFTGGKVPAGEAAIYMEDEWDVARRLTLDGGVRASMFRVGGKTYAGLDPRLSARFRASDRVTFKASYARMQQYIHLLSNNSLLFQTDLWVPTTGRVKPMNSTQYSVGAAIALPKNFSLSVETYYKDMRNVIEYKDGALFTGSSVGWENKVEAGIGRSYGVEIALERRIGSTTGSISYAWSKSERRFTDINFGEWFPAKYDRRHSVNLTVTQRLSQKFDLTAAWSYASGARMTLPLMGVATEYGDWEPIVEERNNYRTQAYHRLDLGLNFHPKKWRRPERYGEWNLSIYNAYNRMNAFVMMVNTGNNYRAELKKAVLFPMIPSISYTYNF